MDLKPVLGRQGLVAVLQESSALTTNPNYLLDTDKNSENNCMIDDNCPGILTGISNKYLLNLTPKEAM